MAEHGGKRTPRKPAPVSGPGAMSKRTDGGPQPKVDLPDAAYGEQQAYQEAQSGAPMAGGGGAPGGGATPPPQGVEVVPFGAPSMRPDEPVTAGSPLGPGPGLESLGLTDPEAELDQADLQRLRAYLPYLEWMASLPGAAPGTRQYVRKVKGLL